jgi:pentose-5-phosphate-3-epimerase
MTTAARQRLAGQLAEELGVKIDGGIGQLAVAAVAATPAGPARKVEIRRWVRKIREAGGMLALLVDPKMSAEVYQATGELLEAVEAERQRRGVESEFAIVREGR